VMPDPTQTHAAAQVVAGVAEFATQAVTYAAAAGPAGPLLLAGDVGMAEADKLKQQGVDVATRTKAGAVAGGVAGLSIALPVAVPGSVAKTTALVVAGGPGGFIGQNAAERAILNNAGYKDIANQYDPLDPVGLALSTLVPAGFGAAAVRGARVKSAPTLKEVVLSNESQNQRFDEKGNVLTSPKGAKGEMQVMDATNLDPGFGVRPADPEIMRSGTQKQKLDERARVGSDYLDAMLKRYGGDEAKAMAAYNAGPGALDAALKKGGNWLDHMPAETQAYVTKGMKKLGGERTNAAGRSAIAADADTVAAARVRQTGQTIDSYRLTPESDLPGMTAHQDAIESAHAMLARGEPVQVADILDRPMARAANDFSAWFSDSKVRTPEGEPLTVYRATSDLDETGPRFYSKNADYAEEYAAVRGATMTVPAHLSIKNPLEVTLPAKQFSNPGSEAAHIRRAQAEGHDGVIFHAEDGSDTFYVPLNEGQARSAISGASRIQAIASAARALQDAMPPRPPRATGAQLFEAAGESTLPTTAKPKADAAGAALEGQTAAALEANPDIMVQMEGMDAPMRADDLLEQLRKEVAEEKRDASLLDVAANCFLRTA